MVIRNIYLQSELAAYWEHKHPKITEDDRDEKKGCITVYRTPKHFRSYFDALEKDLIIPKSKKESRKDCQIVVFSFGLVLLHNEENKDTAKFRELITEINDLDARISLYVSDEEDKDYFMTEPNIKKDGEGQAKVFVGTQVRHFINELSTKRGYSKTQLLHLLFYLAAEKHYWSQIDRRCSYLDDQAKTHLNSLEKQLRNRKIKLEAAAVEFNLLKE